MTPRPWIQWAAVTRWELRRLVWSRRGLWLIVLAVAPVLLFGVHAQQGLRRQERLRRLAERYPIAAARALDRVVVGMSLEDVYRNCGTPYRRRLRGSGSDPNDPAFGWISFTDGRGTVHLRIDGSQVSGIRRRRPADIETSRWLLATVFRSYVLRLAVFFGTLGVFVNLFRSEIFDKTLHFYLLSPMRREILLLGKAAAGLLVTILAFTLSVALQWWAELRQFDGSAVADFMTHSGGSDLKGLLAVTALACVGYGSVFLLAGLVFRRPTVPAAIVLVWEAINPFLPAGPKQIGLIHYLYSLCPASVTTMDRELPPLLTLLISPGEPATPLAAVAGVLGVSLVTTALAVWRVHRLEINYSRE